MIFFRKGVRGQTKSGKGKFCLKMILISRYLVWFGRESQLFRFPWSSRRSSQSHDSGPRRGSKIGTCRLKLKCGLHAIQAAAPEFRLYQEQVLANCQAFAGAFRSLEFNLVSGGTDTHLLLLDLGSKVFISSRILLPHMYEPLEHWWSSCGARSWNVQHRCQQKHHPWWSERFSTRRPSHRYTLFSLHSSIRHAGNDDSRSGCKRFRAHRRVYRSGRIHCQAY